MHEQALRKVWIPGRLCWDEGEYLKQTMSLNAATACNYSLQNLLFLCKRVHSAHSVLSHWSIFVKTITSMVSQHLSISRPSSRLCSTVTLSLKLCRPMVLFTASAKWMCLVMLGRLFNWAAKSWRTGTEVLDDWKASEGLPGNGCEPSCCHCDAR